MSNVSRKQTGAKKGMNMHHEGSFRRLWGV